MENYRGKDRKGKVQNTIRVRKTWSAPIDQKVKTVFIQAGKHLYCEGEDNHVLAVDFSNIIAGARITWSVKIPDLALNMIAGDEKLFVSTDTGRIYCFGGNETNLQVKKKEPEPEPKTETAKIKSIVAQAVATGTLPRAASAHGEDVFCTAICAVQTSSPWAAKMPMRY